MQRHRSFYTPRRAGASDHVLAMSPPVGGGQRFTPNPKLRFLDQCREVLRFFHYARRTEETLTRLGGLEGENHYFQPPSARKPFIFKGPFCKWACSADPPPSHLGFFSL